MKRKKTTSTLRTVLLFVFAASLLAVGGIGTIMAAPSIQSGDYVAGTELYHIGVSLVENGKEISRRTYSDYAWDETYGTLLDSLVPKGEAFHMGQTYPEALSVTNSGSIDEFVRVSVYKYWVDKDGNKMPVLTPGEIDLNLVTDGGWVLDPDASTTERQVLYYTSLLTPGESTTPFSDTLTVNGKLPYKVSQTTTDNVITTTYDYDGVTFMLDVQVDAVQTHSAEAAIKSAWGRSVTVSGTSLVLR